MFLQLVYYNCGHALMTVAGSQYIVELPQGLTQEALLLRIDAKERATALVSCYPASLCQRCHPEGAALDVVYEMLRATCAAQGLPVPSRSVFDAQSKAMLKQNHYKKS
jgi:hypothetical protein